MNLSRRNGHSSTKNSMRRNRGWSWYKNKDSNSSSGKLWRRNLQSRLFNLAK